MGTTILYSLILFIWILVSIQIHIKKNISLVMILLVEYFIISVFSIMILKLNLRYYSDIKLTPYIILLVSYFIIFFPFLRSKNKFNAKRIEITYYKVYNYMVYLYLIFSIIAIYLFLPYASELIINNNWAMVRQLHYDDLSIRVYSNIFERIALNYVSYFRPFVMLIYFIFLKYDYKPKLRLALFIAITGNVLLASMQNVSRRMIFDFFILFFAMFIFFKKSLNKKTVRRINLMLTIVGTVFLMYSSIVTINRFSSTGDFDISAMHSLISYFGQPPLVFNSNVYPITKHTYGLYSFGRLFEMFGATLHYPQASIGGSWGSGFYTYVGLIYIDFGALGVIIHAIFISLILSYLLRRNRYRISTIYLIFIIYEYLLKGAFVIGRNYIIYLVMNIMIFIFIYIQERIKLKSKKPIIDLSTFSIRKIKSNR